MQFNRAAPAHSPVGVPSNLHAAPLGLMAAQERVVINPPLFIVPCLPTLTPDTVSHSFYPNSALCTQQNMDTEHVTGVSAFRSSGMLCAAAAFVAFVVRSAVPSSSASPKSSSSAAAVRVFDFHSLSAGMELRHDARYNRTVWELFTTDQLHAGAQVVQPGAWIPRRVYRDDMALVVLRGEGTLYDGAGLTKSLASGTVVHVPRGAEHAVRNDGTHDRLELVWVFGNGGSGSGNGGHSFDPSDNASVEL